ncbi:MAG: endonuclease/exonuclease/phosphatase family protein [Usitatibacteraceae bacterium]
MTERITIATYNIHKGLSPLNRRLVIHKVREKVQSLNADIVFLQEVQGGHNTHQDRFADWPELAQHEHIAEGHYTDLVYGLNAQDHRGDHGNAILSAFPVINWVNRDVSHHRYESRGHLMARLEIPGWSAPLTCVCVHLGLFARSRKMQIERLIDFLDEAAHGGPLLVAGDFNDWRANASGTSKRLREALGLVEVFELANGKPARTFPAMLPILRLDRIYVRGLDVEAFSAQQPKAERTSWRKMSDHVGLTVTLRQHK